MEMNLSPSAEPCRVENEEAGAFEYSDLSQARRGLAIQPQAAAGDGAWYCIRTHLKHEHIAAAHLGQLPDLEVFNPQLRLLRTTRQGRRWRTESLFPNYVFARFVLDAFLGKVTYTPGVKFVLRFGDRIPEMPNEAIEDMRRGLGELDAKVVTDAPEAGDEVEITQGAFAGMKASVMRVLPGKQRAQILLDVLGRPVQAELSLDLVLFNRKEAAQFALPVIELATQR
jgi:transcriptional antiterminator RfaH